MTSKRSTCTERNTWTSLKNIFNFTLFSRIRTTGWNMFNISVEKSSSQFLGPRIGGRSPSSWSLCRCLACRGREELNSLRRRWSQDNGNPSRPRGSHPAARQRQRHGWRLHLNCYLKILIMSPEPTGLGYDGSADIFCLIYKWKLKKLNNLIFLVSVQEQQQQAAIKILILRHTKVHLSLSSARFQNTNVQSGLIFGYLCCSEYIVTFSFTFCGTEQEQNLFVLKKTHRQQNTDF